MLDQITPLILTYNEAPNIARNLSQLGWARDIVVVDSYSDDDTLAIAGGFPNVRVVQRAFDCFAGQWNFGLREGGIASEWVLALDADYIVTDELVEEIGQLRPAPDISGYRVPFRYCVDGSPLRGSLYPPSIVLFRRDRISIYQDGHANRAKVTSGREAALRSVILHDDRKPFQRWLRSQETYAADEARVLSTHGFAELSWADRVRKVPLLAAPVVAVHCLFAKGCILDGKAGLKYTAERTIAELLISHKLLQLR